MAQNHSAHALASLLKHLYGDLWDMPLFSLEGEDGKRGKSEALAQYAESIRYCQDCSFHIGRKHSVFGRGPLHSPLAFVGDFPSAADDERGEIFTGEVGELLEKMIVAMNLRPESLYLTNLFKCRPAAGDKPQDENIKACEKHLDFEFSQVEAPIVVALGDTAARYFAQSESPLRVLRSQEFHWNQKRVFCTHHPRDLLASPSKKKEAWQDLKQVMRALEHL